MALIASFVIAMATSESTGCIKTLWKCAYFGRQLQERDGMMRGPVFAVLSAGCAALLYGRTSFKRVKSQLKRKKKKATINGIPTSQILFPNSHRFLLCHVLLINSPLLHPYFNIKVSPAENSFHGDLFKPHLVPPSWQRERGL